jgi:hypothetical protein
MKIDKGLLIGIIVSAGALILFLIKDEMERLF